MYLSLRVPTCNLQHVYKHINDFFLGTADYEQWYHIQCVPIPKSGDLSDPNKYRGVMLMDLCSKIFSSVTNGKAFKLLNKHGTGFQFSLTPEFGCYDDLFVLKTLLTMRKNHISPPMVHLSALSKSMIWLITTYSLTCSNNTGLPPNLSQPSNACTKTW